MQATATGRLHAKGCARHSGDPPKGRARQSGVPPQERQSLPRFCNPRGQTPLMHEAQRHIWKHHQSRRSASKGSAPFGPAHRPRGTLGRERDPPWRFTAHDLSHGRGCGYAKHQPPTPHLPAQPPLPLPFRRGLTPSDQRTARESPSAGSATRLGASPHTIFLPADNVDTSSTNPQHHTSQHNLTATALPKGSDAFDALRLHWHPYEHRHWAPCIKGV